MSATMQASLPISIVTLLAEVRTLKIDKGMLSYHGSERSELKLPYVCLGCSNHSYGQQ
jgi:hypothetical protein